jgi:hypothetical protein
MSLYPATGDTSHTVPATCAVGADSWETDNTWNQATTLTVGAAAQNHNFHAPGDVDWVKLNLQANNSYMMATGQPGSWADTVITLYKPDGVTFIAENDDAPGLWPSSRLFYRPSVSGTYYLKVKHFDTYGYGCLTAYTVWAVQARQYFLPFIRR